MRTHLIILSALFVAPALTSAQAPPALDQPITRCYSRRIMRGRPIGARRRSRQRVLAPVLNKYVASGKLLNWGYAGVYIGDQNNRSIYVWAADPVALVQARQVYLPELTANPKFTEFNKICGSATITMHNLITAAKYAGALKRDAPLNDEGTSFSRASPHVLRIPCSPASYSAPRRFPTPTGDAAVSIRRPVLDQDSGPRRSDEQPHARLGEGARRSRVCKRSAATRSRGC